MFFSDFSSENKKKLMKKSEKQCFKLPFKASLQCFMQIVKYKILECQDHYSQIVRTSEVSDQNGDRVS